MTPKTVVVLGKPRSGTSLTAGILSILGVDMEGDSTPTPFNPKGAYEDLEFDDINWNILQTAGGDDLLSPPPLSRVLEQRDQYAQRLQEFFSKKAKPHIWGWKKPSTSLLIELFLPYLVNPYFVVVLRNPIGNAQSLVEFVRHRDPTVTFLDMLKISNYFDREIFEFLGRHKNLPTLFVSFEEIVCDPVKEATRLAEFLGLGLDGKQADRIRTFCIPREGISIQKKLGFLKGLPYKVARLGQKCYRNPRNVGGYLTQAVRLTINVFCKRQG